MALRSRDKIIAKNLAIIYENLKLLEQYFSRNDDLFEWMPPQAGGTGFVKFKGPLSGDELAEELLEEEILVFGSAIFDCDEKLKQYFRIGFSRRTMPAALKAFELFIEERRAQWGHPR
jgi:DNA-binding transcriptional MocR family regulator